LVGGKGRCKEGLGIVVCVTVVIRWVALVEQATPIYLISFLKLFTLSLLYIFDREEKNKFCVKSMDGDELLIGQCPTARTLTGVASRISHLYEILLDHQMRVMTFRN
jgi:hypothetical protein